MKKMFITIMTVTFLVFGFSEISSAASASTYQVKKGDSLWEIANMHKISVSQLKIWNNLKSDLIKPNQVLKVQKTSSSTAKQASTTKRASYKTITAKATAYTASCEGCSGITATGIDLKKNPSAKVIAVDPKVIPLGAKVYVEGYGEAIAGDKGGAIKGNKIDVFVSSKQRAINWGVKTVKVKVYK